MSMYFCTSQSKCRSPPTCLSFRKSSESSRNQDRHRDAEPTSQRKAAAWAWHERGGGDVLPTRPRGAENFVPASKNSKVDRPSLFKVETTRDTGAHEQSTSVPATVSLFDASELSSLAQQIAEFEQRLRDKSSSTENSQAHIGVSDRWNWRASEQASTSDEATPHKASARHRRSSSDPTAPRQVPSETRGALGSERKAALADFKLDGNFPQTGEGNVRISKGLGLRKSLSFIQKLCRKALSKLDEESYSIRSSPRVQSHHHFHHHYHFYHYQLDPEEELRILDRFKGRRHPENLTPFIERRLAEPETQMSAAEAAGAYWASAAQRVGVRGRKADIDDYVERRFSGDNESVESRSEVARDWAGRRQPENFDRTGDSATGSGDVPAPRIRRHSAEIVNG